MPPVTNLDPSKKGQVKSLRLLMGYLRPHKKLIVWALVALLFTSIAMLSIGGALKYLVDEGLNKGNPALLDKAFLLMLGVILLLAIASYVRVMLGLRIGERMVAAIRRDVFERVIGMEIEFFETARTGDLVSRITSDTALLHTSLSTSISFAIRNIVLSLGGIVMLIITSPSLTAYVAIIIPLVVIPLLVLGRKVRGYSRMAQEKIADIGSHVEEVISGIRTVQAFSLEKFEKHRFFTLIDATVSIGLRRIHYKALLISLVMGLIFSAVILVLWMGGKHVLAGDMTGGQLTAFIFYAVAVASSLGALSEIYGELQQVAGATERLMELVSLKPTIFAPQKPTPLPSPVKGEVRFEQVEFHYPSRRGHNAISTFSLDVAPGETVALVGQSGAGKSTLFQLLLRFYDVANGRILVDGVDIRTLDPQVLRSQIGLVPQDPIIFSTNVWDNIRCGKPDAPTKDIITAAEAASALEFIHTMPDGFDTFLGEKGVRLSGGQKQRIAIARAILRNPPILLLDEATSALDSENELKVKTAIDALMKDRTTIVIAHRLSTVMNAHRIVVLHDGKIDAIGTHHELMQTSPLYARLATLQLSKMTE
jgi:ATP-binding cassette subfamily B protein